MIEFVECDDRHITPHLGRIASEDWIAEEGPYVNYVIYVRPSFREWSKPEEAEYWTVYAVNVLYTVQYIV